MTVMKGAVSTENEERKQEGSDLESRIENKIITEREKIEEEL